MQWANELRGKLQLVDDEHLKSPLRELKNSGLLSLPLQEGERILLDEVRGYAADKCENDPFRFRYFGNQLACRPPYQNKMDGIVNLLRSLDNHDPGAINKLKAVLDKAHAVNAEELASAFRVVDGRPDPAYMGGLLSQFMLDKLDNKLRQYQVRWPIKKLFDAEVGGCNFGECTIRLGLKRRNSSSSLEERAGGAAVREDEPGGFWHGLLGVLSSAEADKHRTDCSGETKWADDGTICELERVLNDGARTFSYAVMPAEWTQALATEDLTRASLHAALEAAAAVSDKAVEATLEGLNQFERRMETRYRNPVVVGFGDPSGDEDRTQVGWVIRPQITPQLDGGQQLRRQNARTYPLSAVVSVPSWWRLLKVEVRTSWIDGRRLLSSRPAVAATQEPCKAPDCRVHYVRVPGSVKEIREKLKYEVRDEPYIDFKATAVGQTLEIGRPGQLVIEGGRLWRSTVVRMGYQQADSITVLPNMKGIIADFSCVRPPPGAPESGGQESTSEQAVPWRQDVYVWTSEGRTAKPLLINMTPFQPRAAADDSRALLPCYLTREKEDPIVGKAAPQSE